MNKGWLRGAEVVASRQEFLLAMGSVFAQAFRWGRPHLGGTAGGGWLGGGAAASAAGGGGCGSMPLDVLGITGSSSALPRDSWAAARASLLRALPRRSKARQCSILIVWPNEIAAHTLVRKGSSARGHVFPWTGIAFRLQNRHRRPQSGSASKGEFCRI